MYILKVQFCFTIYYANRTQSRPTEKENKKQKWRKKKKQKLKILLKIPVISIMFCCFFLFHCKPMRVTSVNRSPGSTLLDLDVTGLDQTEFEIRQSSLCININSCEKRGRFYLFSSAANFSSKHVAHGWRCGKVQPSHWHLSAMQTSFNKTASRHKDNVLWKSLLGSMKSLYNPQSQFKAGLKIY